MAIGPNTYKLTLHPAHLRSSTKSCLAGARQPGGWKVRWLVIGLLLLTTGCANGYERFYTAVPGGSVPVLAQPGGVSTVLASTGRPEEDVNAMWAQGFGLLGYATFNGPNQGVQGALAQGKKVGATRVVVSAQYARTVSGAIPLTTPTTTTSYTSGNVSAFGSGGSAFGTYNGTTTTQGVRTTYIPYSVDRYDQVATFFAPLARQGMGLLVRAIQPTEAQAIGTNSALFVRAVRQGSPAFKVDILPGDYLKAINGVPVSDAQTFQAAIAARGEVRVVVLRHGQERTMTVMVPAEGW